jgi:ribonuclease HI
VFDTEVYEIMRALLKMTDINNNKQVEEISLFSDSVPAIKEVQSSKPIPRQTMEITSVKHNKRHIIMGVHIEYRYILIHRGVVGNQKVDVAVDAVAVNVEEGILKLHNNYKE